MANPGFYNDNQFRDYPFITRVDPLVTAAPETGVVGGLPLTSSESGTTVDLPHGVLVDFGCIMEIDSGFDIDAGHYVYLDSIERDGGDVFYFKFRVNSPDADNHVITFQRAAADPEFKMSWEDAIPETAEPFVDGVCPQVAKWSGFLVTGDMEVVSDIVSLGEEIFFTEGFWQVEPGTVQNLTDSYLRAINVANQGRLIADQAVGCNSSSSSVGEQDVITHTTCITGEIKLKEGFNCSIRQDNSRNTITISAGVGLGEGEPCEEVLLYPEEVPPDDSPFLSGGPGCNEVIKSINGVTGSSFQLIAGPGYRIIPDTLQTNKLIIERALSDFALCAEPDPSILDDCVNFQDTFGGTGALNLHTPNMDPSGNGWSHQTGGFKVENSKAKSTSGVDPFRAIALMSTAHQNATVEVDVNFNGANTGFAYGVVYRWNIGTNGGWFLGITAASNEVELWRSDGAMWILVAQDSFALDPNTTYRVSAYFEGTAHVGRVWDGNSLVAQVSATSAFFKSKTNHGIRAGYHVDLDVELDNFTQCVQVESSSSSSAPIPSSSSSSSQSASSSLSVGL